MEEKINQSLISIKTKRHKSLGILCIMLIKAFLTDKKQMSLEEAAEKLDFLGETNEDSVVKSKVSADKLTSEPKAV